MGLSCFRAISGMGLGLGWDGLGSLCGAIVWASLCDAKNDNFQKTLTNNSPFQPIPSFHIKRYNPIQEFQSRLYHPNQIKAGIVSERYVCRNMIHVEVKQSHLDGSEIGHYHHFSSYFFSYSSSYSSSHSSSYFYLDGSEISHNHRFRDKPVCSVAQLSVDQIWDIFKTSLSFFRLFFKDLRPIFCQDTWIWWLHSSVVQVTQESYKDQTMNKDSNQTPVFLICDLWVELVVLRHNWCDSCDSRGAIWPILRLTR